MSHRRKNLFDEWNELLDVTTPVKMAFLRFLRIIGFAV
jgi:hypothetical protein